MLSADNYSLQDLTNLPNQAYYQKDEQKADDNIRMKAIQQAALELGTQAALAWSAKVIDKRLESMAQTLNQMYNFNSLMLKNHVMPPVIVQSNNLVNMGPNGDKIRLGGKSYRIVKQARLVSVAPTWRDYLWMSYKTPELPNRVLMPENNNEKKVWDETIQKAWYMGIQQAEAIYKIKVNEITRDYKGMLLYRNLLAKRMVNPPYVEKSLKGITGNGNQMVIDDQSWTLTDKPQLQTDSNLWTPIVVNDSKKPQIQAPTTKQSDKNTKK
ncbi:type IV secretion system DotC family protein [Thiotrichales bacterium 19X7-9]|nr:type IV secretion system DotC family protein [Thiotrichales bacterium 19X7-9]TNF70082.1 MAG: type IV secretion system protein DotC [Gammaproteobacteria bacterium]UTW41875.1 type IV secretory system conjugative DNA transfer family protein [bacterium SCSIO 12844]